MHSSLNLKVHQAPLSTDAQSARDLEPQSRMGESLGSLSMCIFSHASLNHKVYTCVHSHQSRQVEAQHKSRLQGGFGESWVLRHCESQATCLLSTAQKLHMKAEENC